MRQHTLHDMAPQFGAGLHDDFANAVTHRRLQNLVAIFCGPNDVKPLVKSRVSGIGIAHDLLVEMSKTYRLSGFQNLGEKIRNRFAEADRLKPGGLNPLVGKLNEASLVAKVNFRLSR